MQVLLVTLLWWGSAACPLPAPASGATLASSGSDRPVPPASAETRQVEERNRGSRHRLLLEQPDPEQIARLKAEGIDLLLDFRLPGENRGFDESEAAKAAGLEYISLPYGTLAELTDEIIDRSRAVLREADQAGRTAALHCRSGARAAPIWACHLALDAGRSIDQALAEVRAMRPVDSLTESRIRDHVRRGKDKDAAWSMVAAGELSESQKEALGRAAEAKDVMFSRLLAALVEAFERPGADGRPLGAAGAIAVCRDEAPRIAAAVAEERSLMIGRTSVRLRNQRSAPPTWATELVERLSVPGETGDPERVILAHPDGSLAALLPIKLLGNCVACHGSDAEIDPAVREEIRRLYPNDQATGFRVGDLRGWFWMEVPPAAR